MTSALLWIFLPATLGLALLFFRRAGNFSIAAALGLTVFLTFAAWQLPIDTVLQLGPFSIEISPTLNLFGRAFTLAEADRPLLAFIYLMQSLWVLGAALARPRPLFVPISLLAVGLFVAALSVEPFLYAALIIAVVALIFIPLLVPPGKPAGRGVLRFLIFQLFAVPFILFTGWMLTGVEASPGNFNLVLRAGVLLALGFTFLMALFPFHSWVPMMAEETHPYFFGFLIFFLPTIAALFLLSFLDRYAWLRDSDFVYQLLLLAGTLAVLFGGLSAAGQRNLGRIYAYAAMAGVGTNLQALGLGGIDGIQVFFALLLPQALAMWLLVVPLAVFWGENKQSLRLKPVQQSMMSHPLFSAVMLVAIFSLAGLPSLASFPAHLSLWRGIAAFSPWALLASLLGALGLISVGLRLLFTWLAAYEVKSKGSAQEDEAGKINKASLDLTNLYSWAFCILGIGGLLGYGLLPRLFLSAVPALSARFPQLFP